MSTSSSLRTPGSGENIATLSKTESATTVKVQRVASDTDELTLPGTASLNAVSAGQTASSKISCAGKSHVRLKATFSAPSQDGAFMKADVIVRFYDSADVLIHSERISFMSDLKTTYALTGNYLAATSGFLDGSRHLAREVRLPIVAGAKDFDLLLDGPVAAAVYQCNTWSAASNPNTVSASGNISVFGAAI